MERFFKIFYFAYRTFALVITVSEFDTKSVFTDTFLEIQLLIDDLDYCGESITTQLLDSNTNTLASFIGIDECFIEEDGLCLYEDLQIPVPGSYFFCFSLNETKSCTESFIVSGGLGLIVLNSSQSSPSTFNHFNLSVKFFDSFGKVWNKEVEYTIIANDNFFNKYRSIYGICTNGSQDITTFVGNSGKLLVSAQSGTVSSKEIQLDIRKNKLKFLSIKKQEIDVETLFDIEVAVMDFDLTELAVEDSENMIKLALTEGNLTGENEVKVNQGIAVFKGLKIEKKGEYYIKASSEDRETVLSDVKVIVKNLPLAWILIDIHESIVSYFNFTVNVQLLDKNNKTIQDPCVLNIFANISLFGNSELLVLDGKAQFGVYVKQDGLFRLTVFSNYSISASRVFVASHPEVKMIVRNTFFAYSNCFDIDAYLPHALNTSMHLSEPLTCTLSLEPEGQLFGDLTQTLLNPEVHFSNLTILSPGNYSIKLTLHSSSPSTRLSSATSPQSFQITAKTSHLPKSSQKLTKVQILTERQEINSFFDFPIQSKLFDQNNDLFRNDCEIGLISNSSIYGQTFKTSQTGFTEFIIYVSKPDSIKIWVTACGMISEGIQLSVLPLVVSMEIEDLVEKNFNSFNVSVAVFDFHKRRVESKNGVYDVEIYLKPDGILNGEKKAAGVKGQVEFRNLSVESAGVFTFNAKVREYVSGLVFDLNSNVFTVPEKVLEKVTNYPMIVMIIWFWVLVIFAVVFYISDKDFILIEPEKGPLHRLCPVLILNNPSKNHLRISTLSRVFTIQFLLFLLTFYFKFQVPSSSSVYDLLWDSKEIFLSCEILSMLLAFSYNLSSSSSSIQRFLTFLITTCLIASLFISIRAVIECPPSNYWSWAELFLIFSLLDLLIFQNLIGLSFYFLFPQSVLEPARCKSPDLKKPLLSPKAKVVGKKSIAKISLSMLKSPSSRFTSRTPSGNTNSQIDMEYIKRTTISPDVRRHFNFDDDSTSMRMSMSSIKNESSIALNQGTLSPKPPNIRFPSSNK